MARTVGPDLSSRGFRLNNPFCVAWTPDALNWQGIDKENPKDATLRGATPLCRFLTPVWGMRAGWRTLITHQDKYRANTVRKHIAGVPNPKKRGKPENGWAPAGVDGNYTQEYVDHVAKQMGVDPDDEIDVHEYDTAKPMGLAMMDFENSGMGVPYTDAQIDKALVLAGIDPIVNDKPIASTSAKVTGAGLGLTTVSAIAQQAQDIAEPVTGAASAFRAVLATLKPFAPYLVYVAILVAFVGLATLVYRAYQNRRLGL